MGKIIKKMQDGKQMICHKCVQCGKCCGVQNAYERHIPVTTFDVFNGAKILGISTEKFIDRYCIPVGRVEYRLKCQKGSTECIFLEKQPNGTRKCKIYSGRPFACHAFPMKLVTPDFDRIIIDEVSQIGDCNLNVPPRDVWDVLYESFGGKDNFSLAEKAKTLFVEVTKMYESLYDVRADNLFRKMLFHEGKSFGEKWNILRFWLMENMKNL